MTAKQIGRKLAQLKGQREKLEAAVKAGRQKLQDLTRQIGDLARQEREAKAVEKATGKGGKPRTKAMAGAGKSDEDE